MSIQIFRDIDELLTLEGVEQKNGRKPVAADLGLVPRAAIVVEDKKILWIGKAKKLPALRGKRTREISLGGRHVLPSFVDCHTHLLSAGSRANELDLRNEGKTYQEITSAGGGIHSTVCATNSATSAALTKTLLERAELLRKQGIAIIEIKTGYGLGVAREMRLLKILDAFKKMRANDQCIVPTFLGAHALPAGVSEASYLSALSAALPKIRKFCSRLDIFIEKNFFTVEGSRAYLEYAKSLGFELVIHADQLGDVGASEMAIALRSASAEHLIETRPSTIERLAASDLTCVLLPAADLFLKCAYPQARGLIDAGARVALATDSNPGSSPVYDIQFVGVLARVEMKMSLAEVLAAWTWNPARALGCHENFGSLRAGKSASFNVLRGSWSELFYELRSDQIAQTCFRGRLKGG